MFIDSHCHLDFYTFDVDREAVIERAQKAGVDRMVNAGDDLESSRAGLALAQTYPFIFCAFAVHPNQASKWNKKVEAAFVAAIAEDRLAGDNNIVAIGEIGLDYFRNGAPKEVQKTVLREQVHLALREDLPIIIHCREAFEDTLTILEEENAKRVVFHCFAGDLAVAERVWGHGWLTSFTATLTYPKNDELRRVAAACPSGQFMIETDAPFLPPQSLRGKRNESAFLPVLAGVLAEARGISVQEVAELSSENARQFFGLS